VGEWEFNRSSTSNISYEAKIDEVRRFVPAAAGMQHECGAASRS
jgi:hypothetical protein